jgi:ubiquinone/menaquinone biosynthesis C-methylase UbiE
MHFSKREIAENHALLLERNAVFKRFGYVVEQGADFVLSRALPLPGRVLEIGTGKGRFLAALLRHVPLVTTVDLDAAEQRFARLNIAFEKPRGKAKFVVADAASLPWGRSVFDSVISMNALHHMNDLPRIADELLRVVAAQGKIVLADLDEEGLAIFERVHLQEGRTHPRTKYCFEDLIKHFRAQGWSAMLSRGNYQVVLLACKRPAGTDFWDPNRQGDQLHLSMPSNGRTE